MPEMQYTFKIQSYDLKLSRNGEMKKCGAAFVGAAPHLVVGIGVHKNIIIPDGEGDVHDLATGGYSSRFIMKALSSFSMPIFG